MRVENNKFDGCKTGAFSLRADKSLIVDNEFIDCGIGSIIDASVGFKHTENKYSSTANSITTIGIGTQDLSAATNQFYKNYFEDLDYGIFSSGLTPYSNQGLTYKCNEFEPNSIDVFDLFVIEGTIDKAQGICIPSAQTNATFFPSGNALSHTCPYPASDIEIYPALKTKITYAHHFEASSGPFTPDC